MMRLIFREPDSKMIEAVKNDVQQTLAMMTEHGYTMNAVALFAHYLSECAPNMTLGAIREPD